MTRTKYKRVNWYDGQNVTEDDLDTEQNAWVGTTSNAIDLSSGSGFENEYLTQRVLFDSSNVPAAIQTLLDTQEFDGEPLYETDTFGNTVFLQPSDTAQGNQLAIEVTGADLTGSATCKIFIFGQVFGGLFKEEVFTFTDNYELTTRNHYTNLVSIMTQDFFGNQNTLIDGYGCRDNGGRLRILEALPMRLARDTIMAAQTREPNQDYVNFKPAALFKTLDTVLGEIAASASLNVDDLDINVTATTQRELPANETGLIVAEKFQATTNNIQKVSILLSVEQNLLAAAGEEFDWSGDVVVGIRKLQTTVSCPTATIPGSLIEFDPEPSSLAEVSFDQAGLEEVGIVLSDTPKVVDFVFTQSALANPSITPSIEVGAFYAVTIRRSGDVSQGTLLLEEANNTTPSTQTDTMRMSVFSQNVWTDVSDSDLWFKVYTNAIRVCPGTAYEDGRQITVPKVEQNINGIEEPYIEGPYSFVDVSRNSENYVVIQSSVTFSETEAHPTTGNSIATRIEDSVAVSVVAEDTLTTLIDAGNVPLIAGSMMDNNPVSNPQITGTLDYPWQVNGNTIILFNPSSDLSVYNVEGSVIVPNTLEPDRKYRIAKQVVETKLYGDVNGDGEIDLNDLVRLQALDGYSLDLVSGTISSAVQQASVAAGSVSMEELYRGNVDNSNLFIDSSDISELQAFLALGTAFTAGGSYKQVTLTVENLTDPVNGPIANMNVDSVFTTVPFTAVNYQIDFVPRWDESDVLITDLRRFIPKAFTSIASTDPINDSGGQVDMYLPNDLYLTGDILDGEGDTHPLDLEIYSVVFELPDGDLNGYIDLFTNYIVGKSFSDGSLVGTTALANNQVRVSVGLQSTAKNLDGYDHQDGYLPDDTDEVIGVTYSNGIIRIQGKNFVNVAIDAEVRTKVIATVYLKKAGFANGDVTVNDEEFASLFVSL